MTDKNEVIQTIQYAQQSLKNSPELTTHIYNAMNAMGNTFLSYQENHGNAGWANKVKDGDGKKIWSKSQAENLETLFQKKPQLGGALNPSGFRPGAASNLIQAPGVSDILENFSFDDTFYGARDHIRKFNTTMKTLAQTLGPTSYEQGPDLQFQYGAMPAPIMVSRRLVFPAVNAILESLRMIVTFSPFRSDFVRQISSISIAVLDLSRGNWREAILSILGVWGESPLLFGVIGKMFLWVYNLMSPELQDRLEKDMFDGTKSIMVGTWLYVFSIVSPKTIQEKLNALIETAKEPLESMEAKLREMEAKLQPEAEKLGMKITFPSIPLDNIPSFDDIQNFQALLQQPAFACNPMVLEQLEGLRKVPAVRLVLELLSVPSEKMCEGQPKDVMEAAQGLLKPTIEPLDVGKEENPDEIKVGGAHESFYYRTKPAYPENWESRDYPLEADGVEPKKQTGGRRKKQTRRQKKRSVKHHTRKH
jgi:hypothetical protein